MNYLKRRLQQKKRKQFQNKKQLTFLKQANQREEIDIENAKQKRGNKGSKMI
jgi:hypothetical protein